MLKRRPAGWRSAYTRSGKMRIVAARTAQTIYMGAVAGDKGVAQWPALKRL